MAVDRDFDLLDDYLSNRLTAEQRAEFEQRMEANPDLKSEYQFQKNLIDGIRESRILELKSMLNEVPVGATSGVESGVVTNVLVAIAVTGAITVGLYYYLSDDSSDPAEIQQSEQVTNLDKQETPDQKATDSVVSDEKSSKQITEGKASTPETPKKESGDVLVQRERDLVKVVSSTFVTSSTEVVVDPAFENFEFHYAFKNNKLMLYGIFEKNQYQILEFITADQHVFFLNYKDNYYLLNDNQSVPAELNPIKDTQLLKRLREFRKK